MKMFSTRIAIRREKCIDPTMEAPAHFAKEKPSNVKFYLHMGLRDFSWDIPTLADHLGIHDRSIVSGLDDGIPSLPDSEVNAIYSLCDVGVNTSSCEGWGLVSFEHAATGAAQVMTARARFDPAAKARSKRTAEDGRIRSPRSR